MPNLKFLSGGLGIRKLGYSSEQGIGNQAEYFTWPHQDFSGLLMPIFLLTLACLLLVLYTATALHMYTLGMSYRLNAPIRCDGVLAGTAWCGQSRVHFKL